MNIAAILQKLGMEYIGRYYSIYRGIVIDNEDPEHLGRILVHVPSVQSGLRAWARCKAFVGFNHAGVKFITPKIGDVVFVEFEKGLPLYPIWSYHGWALEETPEEFYDNNTCGFITPFGHKFYVQDKEGKLTLQIGDSETDKDTLVTLTIEKTGHLNLQVGGDTGTSIDIQGKTTVINGGENKGLVNSDAIRSLAQALLKDLLILGSGTNLSTWMGADMVTKLEDPNVSH